MDIKATMAEIGQKAKAAAAELAYASAEAKETALMAAADAVWDRRAEIIAASSARPALRSLTTNLSSASTTPAAMRGSMIS